MKKGKRLPLSVAIISFNEEEDIANTLESIKDIAGEIVVVDSHSGDSTREIATSYGATVYEEDWKGHIEQKNSALQKCTQEWILSVDCDEVVTDKLKDEIIRAVKETAADGYFVNRRTVYLGRLLKHAWQPEWRLRLVRRGSSPVWSGYNPHDVLRIQGTTARLQGALLHYSFRDIKDHFSKVVAYSKIVAGSYHKEGKKFRVYNLVVNPFYAFIKEYLLKGAIFDGLRGLIVGVSVTCYTFLKYLYLWELEQQDKG
ncbi:SPBc2 prophage-derived glycosyltransferase SunS [bacterium BMS3Abin07]|nr:SPBc2 prophage-derived glycosyltransferase SunS [bacterium BMS3Abin07]GBE32648.1 SPBc2 prophage-derived glycosyltransferase SunS [bacterium BMS3Bbin05]HDZ87385.1 glycosyltransferase family 2 protein [Nitrospirota bacterium]